NALNRLCRAAAAGSALATAGWPWVARAATAAAANPSTPAGAEARRPRLVTVGGAITEVVYALGARARGGRAAGAARPEPGAALRRPGLGDAWRPAGGPGAGRGRADPGLPGRGLGRARQRHARCAGHGSVVGH